MSLFTLYSTLGLIAAFVLTLSGTRCYRWFAIKKGVLAKPNFRSLHEVAVPKGGGIVFSLVFVIGVLFTWLLGMIEVDLVLALGMGGVVVALFGLIDDFKEFAVLPQLVMQIFLSGWILFCFNGEPLPHSGWMPEWLVWMIIWFLLVWMINLYNFMDGIDGMASSGAVLMAGIASIAVFINGNSDMAFVLMLLAVCSLGFLVFNWPPASIFMGSSGSLFLGFCFGVLILKTVIDGDMSFWTWLVIFGYFFADTTSTIVLRIIIVKKCVPHRSHAYQNLARIWGSHMKVTGLVIAYHCLWLLPLAILATCQPEIAHLYAIFALVPAILWTLKYGPILSSS